MDQQSPSNGSLADTSFPELFHRQYLDQVTGALSVTRLDVSKTLYFREGRLVFARSTHPNDRLGEFLLRQGRIELRDYLESSARIVPGKRQGAILCEMGAIPAEELLSCVQDQVLEIVLSLFPWTSGTFEVTTADDDTPESLSLSFSIEEVMLKGMRRVNDWQRVWKGVGESADTVFVRTDRAESISYHASLTEDEVQVLSFATGSLNLGRILELNYATDFEACRCVWALLLVGAIEAVGVGRRRTQPVEDFALADIVEEYDRVLLTMYGFIAERLGDLVDHLLGQVMAAVTLRHPAVFTGVHLRNQGRVEYESVLMTMAEVEPEERRVLARAALDDLVATALSSCARELGQEEDELLRAELRLLAPDLHDVPLARLLERAPTQRPV